MKLIYKAPKGQRIKNQFDCISVWTREGEKSLWWQRSTDTWVEDFGPGFDPKSGRSSHHNCWDNGFPRTEKALLRYLERHIDSLGGRDVFIATRWQGHTVTVDWGK